MKKHREMISDFQIETWNILSILSDTIFFTRNPTKKSVFHSAYFQKLI